MKRRTFSSSGLILTLIYGLGLVAAIALVLAGVLYYFASETFQLIQDIFTPLLEPFMLWGNTLMLVLVALVLVGTIFMLIVSSRFIKYSHATKDKFTKKRGMLIFNLIATIVAFAGYTYLLVDNFISLGLFEINLVFQASLSVIVLLHLIAIILIIIGLCKHKNHDLIPNKAITAENYDSSHPAIYTSDLDETPEVVKQPEPVKEEPAVEEKPEEQKQDESQQDNSHKLVEEIGKLDAMRKNGEITQEQYTKLRQNLIRTFVK